LKLPPHSIELRPNTIATDRTMQDWIESCLNEPLEFPPLPLAILDDDRIAIAVEDGVPEANAIVCALVRYLVQHGTPQTMITVVLGSDNQDWRDRLVAELVGQEFCDIKVVKHEPTSQESHGYVGASETADPIYIQRDSASLAPPAGPVTRAELLNFGRSGYQALSAPSAGPATQAAPATAGSY
jgi:hypothetical protein